MRSNDVLGFIFAGTLDEKIPELAASRTTASIPVGGKYRLIDFVLSNMSNSGVNNVGIVAKKNFCLSPTTWATAAPMTFPKEEAT